MTTIPAGPDRDILDGAAQALANANVGFTYRSDDSAYADGEVGVYFGTMPETPDRVVVLNWVALTDDVELPTGSGILQAALRGEPNDTLDVGDLSNAVRSVLHNLRGATWGSVGITQMYRRSSVPMGQDDNERLERADQYYADVEYPANPNIPE